MCVPNDDDLKKRRKRENGFSLVELLIVVVIILIIAAIAIPSLLGAKIRASEASAVQSLHNISTAEFTYASTWGGGYAPGLAQLGGPGPCVVATAVAACLLDDLLSVAPFTKSGYIFGAAGTVNIGGINQGFEVNATPVVFRVTGHRAFCEDQTGVPRFDVNGAAPIGLGPGTCSAVLTVPGTSGPVPN